MRTQIIAALHAARFRYSSELELQSAISLALLKAKIDYEREAGLSPEDRIDFLVGAIGIEVKVGGSPQEIARQLMRYAQHERIESLIVITDKTRIARSLPGSMNGKRLDVVSLAEGAL